MPRYAGRAPSRAHGCPTGHPNNSIQNKTLSAGRRILRGRERSCTARASVALIPRHPGNNVARRGLSTGIPASTPHDERLSTPGWPAGYAQPITPQAVWDTVRPALHPNGPTHISRRHIQLVVLLTAGGPHYHHHRTITRHRLAHYTHRWAHHHLPPTLPDHQTLAVVLPFSAKRGTPGQLGQPDHSSQPLTTSASNLTPNPSSYVTALAIARWLTTIHEHPTPYLSPPVLQALDHQGSWQQTRLDAEALITD